MDIAYDRIETLVSSKALKTTGIKMRISNVGLLLALFTPLLFAQENNSLSKNIFCHGHSPCAGKNPRIKNITLIQEGARPHFSPAGDLIVFDRKNADGYYDIYVCDLEGRIVASLTEGKSGINQKNNGNAIFHPSGKFIVFTSEENEHMSPNNKYLGEPGVGLFNNLWATDLSGNHFWKLSRVPIKKSLWDRRTRAIATVNPHFSKDGTTLIWTERYDEGGHQNWGKWRIKAADFVIEGEQPKLRNERILFTPTKGNYVTAMGFIDSQRILLAGNLEGQHEYGMDQYSYDTTTHKLANLVNTPEFWEEGSTITPDGHIVYMTNQDSKYKFDFNKAWTAQPMERDYYLMNSDGSAKERLTYFNDPKAPEYVGKTIMAVALDASPNGQYLVSTLVIGGQLRIALIELRPLLVAR